jgi:Ca2+-binding RTX toxin-like protein
MANIINTVRAQTLTGTADYDSFTPDFFKTYFENGKLDNDNISAGGSYDEVYLTPGTDAISGGDGYDTLFGLWKINVTYATEANFLLNPQFVAPYDLSGMLINAVTGTYKLTYKLSPIVLPQPNVPAELVYTGTFTGFEGFFGEIGSDHFIGSASGSYSSYFDDFIEEFRPQGGNDTIDGGAGFDVLAYELGAGGGIPRAQGIIVNYATHTVIDGLGGTDQFSNIERILGTQFSDTFNGSVADDAMSGYVGGADKFNGGNGFDTVYFFLGGSPVSGVTADLTLGTGIGDLGQTFTFNSIECLEGTYLNDNFTGSSQADKFIGFDGNDILKGGGGEDILLGGFGDDTIDGGIGNDKIEGAEGLDRINGGAGDDQISGGIGNDVLLGFSGMDILHGDDGNDNLKGEDGNDILIGDAGNDTIYGGVSDVATPDGRQQELLMGDAGIDRLYGEIGDDYLIGGADKDYLYGGLGNDVLAGDSGQRFTGRNAVTGQLESVVVVVAGTNDLLSGGDGVDTAFYAFSANAITASLILHTAIGEGTDQLIDIENLVGSRFADHLTGSEIANSLVGGDGDDVINALGGDDFIIGSAGADTVDGGNGNDTVVYDTAVSLVFNLTFAEQQIIYNILTGSGEAVGDTYQSIEKFIGSSDADRITLRGDAGGNIDGGAGADRLSGDRGADTFRGGDGDDILSGGAGGDLLDGGAGRDTVSYATAQAAVTADLELTAANQGDAAGDSYVSVEYIEGSSFADTLSGDGFGNRLTGASGLDKLNGRLGNDILIGGAGGDNLTGGGGNDTFDYNAITESTIALVGRDIVTDFNEISADRIDLSSIDAITAAGLANDFFTFVGTGPITAVGQVRYAVVGSTTYIYVNTTGSVQAEMLIQLTGAHTLDAGDFLL